MTDPPAEVRATSLLFCFGTTCQAVTLRVCVRMGKILKQNTESSLDTNNPTVSIYG